MTTEYTFTKPDGRKLRGKMYLPDAELAPFPTVIFCHGFGSNYRELEHHGPGYAEAGIACFFFDFCSGGQDSLSDGDMYDLTVPSECGDLHTVVDALKKLECVDEERLYLQGESMGGLVAALVAAERPQDIRALVLWYPAFNVQEDAAERIRQGKNHIFGIPLSPAYNETAVNIDIYPKIAGYTGNVLMIHGDEDDIVPLRYSRRAIPFYRESKLIIMQGGGHGFEGGQSRAVRNHSIAFIKENA